MAKTAKFCPFLMAQYLRAFLKREFENIDDDGWKRKEYLLSEAEIDWQETIGMTGCDDQCRLYASGNCKLQGGYT